ncbi:MAG: sensor domain-containing diguanylate cyclase [bacterium]
MGSYYLVSKYRARLMRNRFEELMNAPLESIRQQLDTHKEMLNSVEDLFGIDSNVTEGEFTVFVQRAQQERDPLESIMWIEDTSKKSLRYLEKNDNNLALGIQYFVGSPQDHRWIQKNTMEKEKMMRALKGAFRGQDFVTIPIYQAESNEDANSIRLLLLKPVFKGTSTSGRSFEGFIGGVFRLDRIIAQTLRPLRSPVLNQFNIVLKSPWPRQKQNLYGFFNRASESFVISHEKPKKFQSNSTVSQTSSLSIGNRKYVIRFVATPQFWAANRNWNSEFLLIFGLILTGALSFYFYRQKTIQKKMKQLAERDSLTGLFSHRHWLNLFEQEIEEASRYDKPLSLLMIDLDHFKQLNDNYGHVFGDRVLEKIGEIIATHARDSDICGRYGGEEFAVLLPETELKPAEEMANRLREKVRNTPFEASGEHPEVTCSIGVAEYQPPESAEEFFTRADKALYQAKEGGRDCVVLWQD